MRFLLIFAALMVLVFMALPLLWALAGIAHWALFGLAIWATVCLLRGPRRHRWERDLPRPPRQQSVGAREPRRRPEAIRQLEGEVGLPLDVQVKVEQIKHKVEVLQRQRTRFPFGSEDLYIVRATANDYLPRTLDAFLAVPPAFRERPMPNSKTPLQELKHQLTLLDTKLDEVAEDLERENMDRLLANRRFLEERFGHRPVTV